MYDKIIEFYVKNNATIEQIKEVTKYLNELENAADKYYALEAAGVDNWNGYSYAMEEYREDDE